MIYPLRHPVTSLHNPGDEVEIKANYRKLKRFLEECSR
jgi:hypothetical protein